MPSGENNSSHRVLAEAAQVNGGVERSVAVFVVKIGFEEVIPNGESWIGLEVDVAFDTSEPPEVLIFQVATVVKAIYLHGEQILPGCMEMGGDIELGRGFGGLGHAHTVAVDVNLSVTTDGAEV